MVGTVIGNYRILEPLGEGGMGVVYKAVDINLDRIVAIKALNTELTGNPELEQRFRAEAKAQGNLNHANVATLYTLLIENGRPWMVMEFIAGENLDQMVRRRGPIPIEEAIPLFRQALSGIGYAHRTGVVHRDIKPANIMLNRQGVVKVMDFGLAKVLGARGLTRTGRTVGTASYMSPEQVLNRGVDFRSDIYSLGVTLYEMLTANVPFRADNDFQVMSDHVSTPAPPLTHFNPQVPKDVEKVVLKALEKNPAARFQSVEEFSAALPNPEVAAVAPALAVAPPEPGQAASGFVFTRERKIIAAVMLFIFALAGVMLAGLLKGKLPGLPTFARTTGSPTPGPANGAAGTPNAGAPATQPDAGSAPLTPAQPAVPDGSAAVAVVPGQPVAPAVGVAIVPVQPLAPADAAPAPPLIIPAGTVVAVRMIDAVNSSQNQAGQRFEASVDAPIVVDGAVVIPAGAAARVALNSVTQVPAAPRSDVQLELVRLSINGAMYRARTSIFEQQSVPRGKKGAAVVGAAVGAIGGFLGHKGVVDSAAAGAASPFVVNIPPQTRIEFTLRRDIAVAQ